MENESKTGTRMETVGREITGRQVRKRRGLGRKIKFRKGTKATI